MSQLTENQIKKIVDALKKCDISSYEIAKKTRITQATIGNYRKGKTIPTQANAIILKQFLGIDFDEKKSDFSQNKGSVVIGHDNHGDIDNRQYYSDSPDVLRAQIDLLDERIREKDAQIREKDAQIKDLHEIIKQLSKRD